MNNQHVVTHNGKWAVRAENAQRVTKQFSTQKEAIEYGKKIAQNNHSELFIHGRDGKIRDRNSYGNDPSASKG